MITLNIIKMKQLFQLISDIHLEQKSINTISELIKINKKSKMINLLIAGDIGNPYDKKYWKFMKSCTKHFKKVFFVSGNHEYYHHKNTIKETDEYITNKTKDIENLWYLNNSKYEDENYTIYGATLWTKIPDNLIKEFTEKSYDNKAIENFSIKERNKLNEIDFNYLKKEIESSKNKNNIIMTHHVPIKKLIHKKYYPHIENKTLLHANEYSKNFDFNKIALWVCGHSHSGMFCNIDRCLFKLNPIGYAKEISGYKETIIEI
jgi:predicted phosphodiesterase